MVWLNYIFLPKTLIMQHLCRYLFISVNLCSTFTSPVCSLYFFSITHFFEYRSKYINGDLNESPCCENVIIMSMLL